MFPLKELISRSRVLLVLLDGVNSFEGLLDLLTPHIEDFLKLTDHVLVDGSCSVDVFGIVLILSIIWIKGDVRCQTFQCFSEFISEFTEDS